ncbi:prolyl oligopeptidase [Syncephalis pseudoplumigaleata]|uniref:Prolyl endopeptidase n=1 Tax=Syncephalis pseudoplumigaleata TaxID=1712513 RepID=A0A4V1J0U9_9FUNG|nr:prolyl oligopeptidase [Syncephalis pseudoplumigaleata]|eukprot:RKP22819.1 prolyl oligopeptidase [Syncephalis pseudoplumigaleata]
MDYLKQDSRQAAYKQTAGQFQEHKEMNYIHKRPNYYFTSMPTKGSNSRSSTIYRQKTLNGQKEHFFNMVQPFEDGPLIAGNSVHSPSGKFLAYAPDSKSTVIAIRVVCAEDVEGLCKDKGPTADVVQGDINVPAAWTHDDRGFFYTKAVKPSDKQASSDANAGYSNALYYHRLGTQQSQDQLISLPPGTAGRIISVDLSSDGKWLMLSIGGNGTTSLWVASMDQDSKGVPQKPSFRKLANTGNDIYSHIGTYGSRFYFIVNIGIPQSKVVAYDTNAPNDGYVDVFTAKDGHEISSAYAIARNHILVQYFQGGISTLAVYEMGTGKHVRDIELPLGSVKNIWAQPDDGEVFFSHESLLSPQTVYRYDFASNALSTISEAKISGFDASAFEVRQVSVAGKNGASFPMFIAARKGIQLDGSHPAMISILPASEMWYTPWFIYTGSAFMKHFRGVLALIRTNNGPPGDSGADKKNGQQPFQRSIDNIKSASAYLAQHNYTKPALLTVHGTSAEATVVAAAVNQAPDQFGCALIEDGTLDLLRLSQQDQSIPLQQPFGDPAKKEDFDRMLQYSPLQHVDGNRHYPAMLLTTSQGNTGVPSWHSYKMTAELQHKLPKNPRPLMLREYSFGDNWMAYQSTSMADMLSFIATSLGLKQNA